MIKNTKYMYIFLEKKKVKILSLVGVKRPSKGWSYLVQAFLVIKVMWCERQGLDWRLSAVGMTLRGTREN